MRGKLCLILLFICLEVQAYGPWNFMQDEISLALASEGKMPNEQDYEGAKLFVTGQWLLDKDVREISADRMCCSRPAKPTLMIGQLDAAVHIGLEGSGLEYFAAEAIPWAMLWEPGQDKGPGWYAAGDLLQLLSLRYVQDEPLEVDEFLELALARAGRLLRFEGRPGSPHSASFGFLAATGWTWAETEVAGYSDVSNPWAGVYFDLTYDHERLGGLYGTARFVNGFSFSNPSRGHPTVREAFVGAGYRRTLNEHLRLRIYWEKRSFYFDEGDLPSLYSWVRTYAAAVSYHFGR